MPRQSPPVPDRTWYDPELDVYMHTGDDARILARMMPPGHVAMDIETPGLDDAFTINCVTASWDDHGQTHCVLLDPARRGDDHQMVELIQQRASMLIFHNAPFDVPALFEAGLISLHTIGKIVDTLVLARFGFPDVMQRKTLAALAKAHLGMDDNADGMKLAMRAAGYRTIDEGYRRMDIDSPIYRQGAMLDTLATLRLQPILREHAWAWTLDHPFSDHGATTHGDAEAILERQEQVHRVMLRRTAVGLAVDREYLTTYAEQIDQQRLLATAELAVHGLEGGSGKGAALVQYLFDQGELPDGWPRTRTRKLSATKADLARLSHPLADAQRMLANSDKIMGYLEKVYRQAQVTGRCHPQVGVLGASATGRMSYSSPEMQQFPKEARPIITDDGQGLTSIDWAQIEPVTMALMARDEGFLAPFEAGEDLYEPIQRSCGLSLETLPDGRRPGRELAKIVLLATMYGQGVNSLAARINHTAESAAQIRRQMIAAMPMCGRWMRQIESISDQYGIIPTAAGRILPVDKGYGYKAVNYVVQGSAYDVLAHTIAEMDRQGIGEHVQLAMHDELVVDTGVAETVQEIMSTAPPFLEKWAGRSFALRTDRADMASAWAKV